MRRAGPRLAYLMVPKPESLADVQRACDFIDHTARACGLGRDVPVHALIETHGALRDVVAIAAHPRIESISFGLMDFVSEHRGAIPSSAMGVAGQFEHPLVLRAKVEIAAAAHTRTARRRHTAWSPSSTTPRPWAAPRATACQSLAYTRMWSIHPNQIRPIVEAFCPRRRRGEPGRRGAAGRPAGRLGTRCATRPAGRTPCTTAPATATSGTCWSARARHRPPAGRRGADGLLWCPGMNRLVHATRVRKLPSTERYCRVRRANRPQVAIFPDCRGPGSHPSQSDNRCFVQPPSKGPRS